MPIARFQMPDGRIARFEVPEGTSPEQAQSMMQNFDFSSIGSAQKKALSGSERYAAEDAAQEKANKEANVFQQFGRGLKAQAGRFALGATELANNLTGDRLIDPEVLAAAQQGADVIDRGTGTAGFIGNIAGDPLTWALGGVGGAGIKAAKTTRQAAKAAAKAGAVTGALSGATQSTGNVDSSIATNLQNAALGAGIGGTLGAVVPNAVSAVKGAGNIAGNTAQRIAAGFGSDTAAQNVAYRNIAKILSEQGYQPSEVASVIDEFRAQGIKGGTLGQMLGSSDLLAREKNLLQGGGLAGRVMSENFQAQPELVAESINRKIGEIYQPETTSYLYNKASEFASVPTAREKMGAVTTRSTTAANKYLTPAVDEISKDLSSISDEIPSTVNKSIKKYIQQMRDGTIGVDKGKQLIRDFYVENTPDATQTTVNKAVASMSSKLNTALEQAGGEPYAAAKIAAESDRVVREALDAFDTTNVGSLKTALNKFYGTPEKQREFLDKLPNEAVRREFKSYLDNLQKISGKFGGSDTASNLNASRVMNAESGFGFEGDITPKGMLQTLSAPIQKNVRRAQAEATFKTDVEKLKNAMTKKLYKADILTRGVPQSVNRINEGISQSNRENLRDTQQIQDNEVMSPRSDIPQNDMMNKIAMAESSGNPNAQNPYSTASGLYQFTDQTWKDSVNKWGKKYGITQADKNNSQAQELMVRELAADNARILTNNLNRQPTVADMYVAHVFGAGQATKLINALGTNKPAIAFVSPAVIKANQSIFFDKRRPRSVEEVYALLGNKVIG